MDATWPDSAAYACRCGTMFAVTYWRWVDARARPDLDATVQRDGPYEGNCPDCSAPARCAGTWLRIDATTREAALQVGEAQRGSLLGILREHLDAVEQRAHAVRPWMLQPTPVFYDLGDPRMRDPMTQPIIPAASGELFVEMLPTPSPVPSSPRPTPELKPPVVASPPIGPSTPSSDTPSPSNEPPPGVPQLIGADTRTPGTFRPPVLGAYVGELVLEGEHVVADAIVDPSETAKWEGAKLVARPVLLRDLDYPLLGVRIVSTYMGQKAMVDAVIDPSEAVATEVFRALAQTFSIKLRVRPGDATPLERSIAVEGLEPNAALCLESARTVLANGRHPPDHYIDARKQLAAMDVEARLTSQGESVSAGAYQHIVGASEAIAALALLERISNKESLARLLEVEGLPMGEYDELRRRVLQGALDHGLVAPRRFWRRMVASGLVPDLPTYAQQLCEARAEFQGEEGDLSAEDSKAAWEGIAELCRRKKIEMPLLLRAAIGDPDVAAGRAESAVREPVDERGSADEALDADAFDADAFEGVGEFGADADAAEPDAKIAAPDLGSPAPAASAQVSPLPPPPPPNDFAQGIDGGLLDPATRLKFATEVLQGRRQGEVRDVFVALDQFDNDELLALLPDLAELGPTIVPQLITMLGSERREVRQAATVLLGLTRDPTALEPLADRLVIEESTMWSDIARALGSFGPTALRRLCQVLRREGDTPNEQHTIERVARALAEVALSDGDVGPGDPSPGHDAIGALADAGDSRVRAAARLALATLRSVSESSAAVRGERPLTEDTQVRGFARRAYEAITVPEVEVEAEA